MNARDYSYIIQDGSAVITLFSDGSQGRWLSSQPQFSSVVKAINDGIMFGADIIAKFDDKTLAQKAVSSFGDVSVTDDGVFYKGSPITMYLTQRMIALRANNYDISPLTNFLGKLMGNPSYRAVNQLYGFLEKSGCTFHPDGDFIAYKIVKDNYFDVYSGQFDNSVGKVVEMPRNAVNEDENQTCSAGLHVCSKSYLPSYGGAFTGSGRIVIVKINPADVVAVPTDYNNAKMRVCKYTVIGELDKAAQCETYKKIGLIEASPAYGVAGKVDYGRPVADPDEEDDTYGDDGDNPDDEVAEAKSQPYVKDTHLDKFYPATIKDIRDGRAIYYKRADGTFEEVDIWSIGTGEW